MFKKLLTSYVINKPRFGRLTIITFEIENTILIVVRKNRYDHKKISFILIAKQGLSSTMIFKSEYFYALFEICINLLHNSPQK